ncbi:MAG: hypothetical protein Ct9H300mP16_16850 [Pseudomonadota bacterium]|nr:MAG: hypothetical protein Ct9H300mP16_16850 [Pseudomonadota bacterium]
MAEWIVHGDPGIDVSRFSLSRFSAEQNDEAWLRDGYGKPPAGISRSGKADSGRGQSGLMPAVVSDKR